MEQMQFIKNLLADDAPGFMTLAAVCAAPPIDFGDARQRAKAYVAALLARLHNGGGADAVAQIQAGTKLTFAYLLMQLHSRSSQQFWAAAPAGDVFAFLAFATLDLYADILSHLPAEAAAAAAAAAAAEGPPPAAAGVDVGAVLPEVISEKTVELLQAFYNRAVVQIARQRARHAVGSNPPPAPAPAPRTLGTHRGPAALAVVLGCSARVWYWGVVLGCGARVWC